MARLHKLLVIALLCVSATCGFGYFYLAYHYAGTKPRSPEVASGRTHVLNYHGTVVYLTKDEDDALLWLQVLAFGIALAGGALSVRFKVFQDPLRGLSQRRREEVLKGPGIGYEAARKTYDGPKEGGA